MNIKQALACLKQAPRVITSMRSDLGPRFAVDVMDETDTTAKLRVDARLALPGRSPAAVTLRSDATGVYLTCDATAKPIAAMLAMHLHGSAPDGAGPVTTAKTAALDATSFDIGFSRPMSKAAQSVDTKIKGNP